MAERLAPKSLHAAERWAAEPPRTPPAAAAELPLAPIRPWLAAYLAKRARVRIDKARDRLGYDPAFGLDDGMRLTEAWARWTGLAPLAMADPTE